jgi:hypothetical protein
LSGLAFSTAVYGLPPDPDHAKEARCFGAVAAASDIHTLLSAVMRALGQKTHPRLTSELLDSCRKACIEPFQTPRCLTSLEDIEARPAQRGWHPMQA